MAKIYINKLEASRRQIDAAIRMLLAKEDSLAIHTVAAAGYRVLRDLFEHRGKNDLDELLTVGIYQAAREYSEGLVTREQLDELFKGDNFSQDVIVDIAKDIKDGAIGSREEMKATVVSSVAERKERYKMLGAIPNFLKHADQDQNNLIELDNVDNIPALIELLSHAAAAYSLIAQSSTSEMRVIMYLHRASMSKKRGYPPDKIEEHLAAMTESQRLNAGKKLLDIFRAESGVQSE